MPSKKRKSSDENENSSNGKDDKKVVTEGDAMVKLIQTLSYIQVSDTLSIVIKEHHKELRDTNYRKNESRSKRFFNLVEDATTCLNDGIKGIAKN